MGRTMWGAAEEGESKLNISAPRAQAVSVRRMWGSAEVVVPLVEVAILLLMKGEQQPIGGVLTSPNYPDRYPDNIELVQKIQVPEGNTIWIRFTDFQCDIYDKVRITDEGQFGTALESLYSSSEEEWLGPRRIEKGVEF